MGFPGIVALMIVAGSAFFLGNRWFGKSTTNCMQLQRVRQFTSKGYRSKVSHFEDFTFKVGVFQLLSYSLSAFRRRQSIVGHFGFPFFLQLGMNLHIDHQLGGHEPSLGLESFQGWVKQAKVKPGRGHRTENSGVEFYWRPANALVTAVE